MQATGQIRKQIIANLISHTSPKLKNNSEEYLVSINGNTFKYSMEEYNDFVNKKIYSQKSKISPSSGLSSDVFYKSMLDNKILYDKDDFDISKVSVNIPLGFKNRLDTTFTKPIKIEHFYEDSIYAVKVLNFDPTENFDDLNDNEDDGKDAIKEYMNSQEKPAGEKIEIPDSMESSE